MLGATVRTVLSAIGVAVLIHASSNASMAAPNCVSRGQSASSTAPQSTQYRIDLLPPEYPNGESVRRHFIFSRVWSAVLQERLKLSTHGSCSAIVLPLIFPDLFVELFPRGKSATDDTCLSALSEHLRGDAPDSAISDASSSIADDLKRIPSKQQPYAAADYVFRRALREIYANGSVMHALMSVDAAAFEFGGARAFREWLGAQTAPSSPRIVRIPDCDGGGLLRAYDRGAVPYSHVVQPGIIKLYVPADDAAQMLDRVLLLGVPEQNAIGGQVPWRAESASVEEFCNKRQKFRLSGSPESEKSLQILCLRAAPFGNGWLAFFCDPKDCTSVRDAESALNEIRTRIEARDEARSLAQGHEPRGPYLVEVHSNKN